MDVIAELNDKYGNAVFRLFTSRAECREGQYRMHRHTQYEIGLIEPRLRLYDTEHGREEISSGDVFLFSANEYHCITDIFPCGGKRDMQILNLQFLPGFILQDSDNQGESFMRVFTDRKADFCNKLDEINKYTGEIQKDLLCIKEECEQKQPCYEVIVKGLLCSLLITLYRHFGLCEPGKRRQADLHAPRRSNARGGLHERALLRGHHAFRHIIGGKPRENRFRLRFPRSIRHDRVGLRQHQTHRKVAGAA